MRKGIIDVNRKHVSSSLVRWDYNEFCAVLDRYIGRHIDRCSTDILVDMSTNTRPIYILLDVLLCSIAEYFYELCLILTNP